MRIGFVLGLPADEGVRHAARLARGEREEAPLTVLGEDGVALCVRDPWTGRVEISAGTARLHDGWVPGDPGPEGTAEAPPDSGVTVTVDRRARRLVVARDPVGVRPFHLARTEAGLVLGASQLAPLAARPDVKAILMVPPGHVAVVGPGDIRISEGTAPAARADAGASDGNPAPDPDDLDAACARLRRELERAVRRRVPDGPYAVLLSGGVDSSTVLALAHRVNSRVRAVTVAGEESQDAVYARRLTDELGIPLEVVPAPTEAQLLGELDTFVSRLETWESQILTHAFPTWTGLSAAARFADVVLTGEGSDELFGGYRSGDEPADEIRRRRLREFGNLYRTSCQRLDRMGAQAGVDVRLPFLAPAVVRTALAFPPGSLVHDGLSKWPLRQAMRDVLPEFVLARPKLTFARGVGYRYGAQDRGEGLLARELAGGTDIPAGQEEIVGRLANGPLERYTLSRFLDLGYGKADYLLSRTL